jgi:glycosyltransferase involved in cell wall biosynthesis
MPRKKILWLTSWYPNRNDIFDGDFIQRHARAAAIDHDIHVIFVGTADISNPIEEEWNYVTGLTEQLIYFNPPKGAFSRIRKHIIWKKLFGKAIDKYVAKHGIPDLVHIHIPWKAGMMGTWMKKKYGTPFLLSEHWNLYNDQLEGNYSQWPSWQRMSLEKIVLSAGRLITVSRFLSRSMEKQLRRAADYIVPNVVDTTLFHLKEDQFDRFSFLHVSNMVPLKNAGIILKAFQEFIRQNESSDAQLLMIGNRDDQLPRQAEAMGLLHQRVFFSGEIPYTAVAEEMRRAHCLVLFSDSETFSCVTAEALCCGLPVLASEVGALPELIGEGQGILVPRSNEASLVAAMTRVWQDYKSFDRHRISREATARYSYSAVSQEFARLYQ